ncbi:hypothetical protein FKG94_02385 [Exilibacterium tricleocarpae]|uniref:DUF2157 domain-containing protein n=1 Tax=Exilibacterium tricleocarpae TaxID=2591008 RepID=A0A545U8B2_9GAMM|nr:hypothetical protein [Exilibacterium tricleocarpae]TQV85710.1 hypothetical protein FKG94_02385 [Exilibacterium tricleocarpae]
MQTEYVSIKADTDTPPARPAGSRLASLLRWLGAGAVALSALIYLLQGVEHIDLQLRNWVYLILMGLLCGGGVISRLAMDDAKSARLLFALAAALIPVQFSQLGGMLFEWVAVSTPGSAEDIPAFLIATVAAATLGLSAPVAFAGFSVLARREAKTLCLLFLAINATLLLPVRTSVAGIGVLGALVVAALAMEQRFFSHKAAYRTLEGRAIRAMFLAPLFIALARAGFHADTLAGYCALGGIASLMAIGSCRHWTTHSRTRELLLFGGVVLGAVSWTVYALNVLNWHQNAYQSVAMLIPLAGLLFTASRYTPARGRTYRTAGTALLAFGIYLLLCWETTVLASLSALLIATALLAWGILLRYREPTLSGGAGICVSLTSLVLLALTNIHTSTWIMLAGVGLACVLGASVVERYGRRFLTVTRDSWVEVSGWR